MRGWRNIVGVAAAIFLIALFAVLGVGLASLPAPQEVNRVSGLAERAQVLFDGDGVPYIFAADFDTAAFALGYAHARDRMWQMELQRRFAQGRLSEIFGERSLAVDRQYRTLGLYRAAEESVRALDQSVVQHLQAYANGVNAWIEQHDGAMPIEFLVLGHRPEPWRIADSLAWAKVMALRLSGNYQGELLRLRLARKLSPEHIEELWPPYPADAPITLAAAGHAASPTSAPAPREPIYALDVPLPVGDGPRGASNTWVVSGARTESGKPILANDPHLGFAAPILWYLAKIVTAEGEVTGATLPGLPYVIVGHNGRIAWGMTASESDLQDLVLEGLSDESGQRYDTPEGPRPFLQRSETLKVKGRPDVSLDVRETRHGPVIIDNAVDLGDGRRAVAALQATFLSTADTSLQALHGVNRARNRDEFVAALSHAVTPQLNFSYADVDGGIGFYAPGRVPIRSRGNGFYARAGWTAEDGWRDFVAFDELPHVFDPPAGLIVNANNKIAGPNYRHFISRDWEAPFRAERILAMFAEKRRGRYEMQDAVRMQSDDLSLMAKRLLPLMTNFEPEAPLGRRIVARMRTWNAHMERDDGEPLIFVAWLRRFNQAVYEDDLGDDFPRYWSLRPLFISQVLSEPARAHWCDDRRTPDVETCRQLLESSLMAALDDLAKRMGSDNPNDWRWGDVHKARFDHALFSSVPVLNWIANLSIETDGSEDTVGRGGIRPADDVNPFAHVHGAGFRGVYDLADLDHSRFIIATGQSGHILSPHYRGLMRLWRDGGFIVLGKTYEALAREARLRITLIPN